MADSIAVRIFIEVVRDQLDIMEVPIVSSSGFELAENTATAQGVFESAEIKLIRNILIDVDVIMKCWRNIGFTVAMR